MQRSTLRLILAFATFVCQHLTLAYAGGFPITVGSVAGVLLGLSLVNFDMRAIRPGVLILIVTPTIIPLLLDDSASAPQYLRTLCLILFAAIVLQLSIYAALKTSALHDPGLARGLYLALLAASALSVGQVLTGARGSEALFNPWGTRQYLYQYDPHLEFNPVPRAQGFYLEPSYDAFVIGTLAIALLCLNYRGGSAVIIALVGLSASQSATGLLIAGGLIAFGATATRGRLALLGVGAIAAVVIQASLGTYLVDRVTSIGEVGSSANYRLEAPLKVLGQILNHHWLGMPLGSIQATIEQYSLRNGATIGASLDNGFYVLVYYFGWLGIASCAVIFVGLFCLSLRHRFGSRASWLTPLWILGSLNFSGGILLPEYCISIAILIVLWRHHLAELDPRKAYHDALAPASKRGRSDLQGPPRLAQNT